jgi:hypothetical protein
MTFDTSTELGRQRASIYEVRKRLGMHVKRPVYVLERDIRPIPPERKPQKRDWIHISTEKPVDIECETYVKCEALMKAVSKFIELPVSEIKVRTRIKAYVIARWAFARLAYRHSTKSLSWIGLYSNQDHTTVINALEATNATSVEADKIVGKVEAYLNIKGRKVRGDYVTGGHDQTI